MLRVSTPRRAVVKLSAALLVLVSCEASSPAASTMMTAAGDTVQLSLMRTGSGSGDVLVSSGIPLPPGWLQPGATANVAVTVGGQEQAIYIEPLVSRHADGSLRSILVQFRHALSAGTPVAAALVIGPDVTRGTTDLTKAAVSSLPAAVALPTSAEYLVSTLLVGPTIPVAQSPFATYESNFVQYGNSHWASEAGDYYFGYYERSLAWFAYWVRTGTSEYWRRGMIDLLAYRDDFLVRNGWYMQPHDAFFEALGVHYLLTGDELDRTGIGRSGHDPFYTWWFNQLALSNPAELEARIAARTLLTFLAAWRYNVPSAQGHNWTTLTRQTLDRILAKQGADGSWKFRGTYDEQWNFMAGIMMDALIKYYEWFEADPRIPASIQGTLDYLWNTQWIPSARAFRYASGNPPISDPSGSTPVPDLNLLICHSYSWYYSLAPGSRGVYKTRADECFNGGIAGAWLDGFKQFNQNYQVSFRHLSYRR